MAHSDYDCCAICDGKLFYNPDDPTTKELLCTGCVAALEKHGVIVTSVRELLDWMSKDGKAVEILEAIGFSECYFRNEVDELYRRLKGKEQP